MSNLTTPKEVAVKGSLERKIRVPVLAAKTFYRGAAVVVALGSGYATNPGNVNTEEFLGFCAERKVDNSGGSSGDKYVDVVMPDFFAANLSGAAVTDIGKPAFWSDDNALTLTANNNYAGHLAYVDADGTYWVKTPSLFGRRASAAQAAVATTGATNSSPYGFTTAAQADAIVTLVNELRTALINNGFIKGAS